MPQYSFASLYEDELWIEFWGLGYLSVTFYYNTSYLCKNECSPSATYSQMSRYAVHYRKVSDVDEIIQEPPTTLTAEQRALLEGIPKYDMIGDYLRKVHTEMDLFVSMLELIGDWRESICCQWRIQDFAEEGAPTPKSAILEFFAENCMKMKEIGPPPPLDRPMVVAIRNFCFQMFVIIGECLGCLQIQSIQ